MRQISLLPRLYLLLVPSGLEHKLVREASPPCFTVCPLSLLRPVNVRLVFLRGISNCPQLINMNKSR